MGTPLGPNCTYVDPLGVLAGRRELWLVVLRSFRHSSERTRAHWRPLPKPMPNAMANLTFEFIGIILYRGYIGIMEKKKESTIGIMLCRGYISSHAAVPRKFGYVR